MTLIYSNLSKEDNEIVLQINSGQNKRPLAKIKRVIIEIHNYCNRVCQFCPNSIIDRKSKLDLMDPTLFSKIVDELSEANYENKIFFGRYH